MIDKIAASYGRTSKEKDDAFSVISQLKGNREYAIRNAITLPPEYEFPEDFSGRAPAHERPEYKKILALIRSHKINTLIVYATDRFARDIVIGGTMLNELVKHRIELHIVGWNGSFRDTPEGWARFNFEMTFSDFERRKIVERTQRGKREMIAQSIWVANGPVDKYGFHRAGKKRESHLVHVPEEVAIVRSIFDTIDKGK